MPEVEPTADRFEINVVSDPGFMHINAAPLITSPVVQAAMSFRP